MTYVTCRLTAKDRNQLRNPTLGNRVWTTFTFLRRWTARRDVLVKLLCVGTSCSTKPEQIEVMELEGHSRSTCNKLCTFSRDALDRRRCYPQARRRRVLLTAPSTCRGKKNSKSKVLGRVRGGNALIFEISEFPYDAV